MVVCQVRDLDAEALRDHERCRVAAEHELLGERIDDIRRRTLVVDDRQIVTLEETAEPRPRKLVPVGRERRDVGRIEAHVAGPVDHDATLGRRS
jgi:hypothetical protein